MTNLTASRNADAARQHLEALHWPEGPVCPYCGSVDARRLPHQRGKSSKRHPEGSIRKGVVQCNDCRQQYTVTVGTVFEYSKIPLNKWLLATHLMVAGKKGISAHQLHRMLGVTYKTAWFMAHRIREAMATTPGGDMGSGGGMVEVDETFIGRNGGDSRMATRNMNQIVSLVDRTTGRSASVVVFDKLGGKSIGPILAQYVASPWHLLATGARLWRYASV
jgi:transposase-like protein